MPRSERPVGIVAFVIAAPLAAYVVHRISSGDECGWSYGAVGGACRAIILLSIVAGAAAGGLAAATARAVRDRQTRRASWFGIGAVVAVVLGTLAANQFQDYRHAMIPTMDARTCGFVREKLLPCVKEVMGDDAYRTTVRAQHGCDADAQSILVYQKCIEITDCKQMVDCITESDR